MITMQDALERAKLSADESGYISQYMYNQLIDQLEESEHHAFTLALVDLGIQTKFASRAKKRTARSILERLKRAQTYQQSEGGIWMPQSYDEPDEPEEPAEQLPQGAVEEAVPDNADENIIDYYDVDYLLEILTNAGIGVDSEGNVKFYKSNVPGIFTDQIPMTPMPMEKALKLLQGRAKAVGNEQTRVHDLQDLLAGLTGEFNDVELSFDDLLTDLSDIQDRLNKYNYQERSPDPAISEIATSLSGLRDYLLGLEPELESIYSDLDLQSGGIKDLQGQLDNYFQTQYDVTDEKTEVVDAMEALMDIRSYDPEEFAEYTQGMGGVAARFKRL